MKSARAFLRLLAEAPRGRVISLLILMTLSGLTEGIGLLLLVPLLGMLQNEPSQNSFIQALLSGLQVAGLPPSPAGLLTAFLVLVGLRSGVQYARERLGASLQHQLVDQLRLRCFSALLGVEWRWIAASRQSDHANLLLADISRVGVGLNYGLSLLAAMATMLTYLLAAIALSWSMTVLAAVSGGIVMLLLSGQRKHALDLGHSLGKASRVLHGNVQESLAGIKLAKILGNERRHLDLFITTTSHLRQQQLRFSNSTNLSRAFFQFGGALLLVSFLYIGLRLWHTPVPELLTLVLIFSRLIPQFVTAQQQFYYWLHALPALEETDKLLSECSTASEPEWVNNQIIWPINTGVSLNGVTIRYSERSQPALDRVSVSFPARSTTAIIGASGAGKSTLADVLMGLLAPDEGELQVDGVSISSARRRSWRNAVSYVPQEVFLFNDSIRNNLLWAKHQAQESELRQSLERAAADFVFKLPQGLDTQIGDGGVRLSGGERQRIALARALLKRPSLLILDEATSALDIENEARVREAIEHLHGDLTVVIIGHRLSTLEHADQVIVLEAGRIRAQGSWAEVRRHQEMIP